MQLVFQREGVAAHQQDQRDHQRQAFAGAPALDELAKNPRGQGDHDEKHAEPQNRFAVTAGGEVEQPHGGRQHGKAHRDLEFFHPRAGLGQEFQPRRVPAQHDIRRGQSDADGQKHQQDDRSALREGESEGDAQERRGAGRGQRGGQHAVEECARRPMFRRQPAGGIQGASAERDFKHAEQIQRHQRDQRGEADDKDRAAELHAPAGMMSGGLDADDDGGEHEKRHQHAEGIDEAELADVARVAPGFADKAKNFQRDDRQHAGHDVQNQSADERVEQHAPERLSGQGGGGHGRRHCGRGCSGHRLGCRSLARHLPPGR